MQAVILFASFFILLILAVPIGYSIGIATLIALVFGGDGSIPLLMIAQKAITGCDSFPLMAVPFFMLAGNLMSGGGIAKRILDFFDTFMGFITGGLSMVTTITCMFFAAISGSAMATTSAVGSFMIPAMKEHGYDEGFSAGICAAAGTIGVIIPPSIPFVIYGVATGTSITD
ncbi:MAG: TRAP transporter large permease subunit, partial [Lachnospiraceae bacterium]|nr:TRAP transporter large permease subunit [Lachnospiraceae bacterium]